MGRQLAGEIERQVKLLNDPAINEYVNRVGQNIVRNSDAKVPFTIKVVESDEINAFALPGGFFYVNSGLILAADDESELAAVMAHENCTCRSPARDEAGIQSGTRQLCFNSFDFYGERWRPCSSPGCGAPHPDAVPPIFAQ
jgi:predicted Zn-dependent protease